METDKQNHLSNDDKQDIIELVDATKTIKNPFLSEEVKNTILGITYKNFDNITLPQYFPKNLEVKLQLLISKLKNYNNNQVQLLLTFLHQSLNKLPYIQNRLWHTANLMINLPSIKKLSSNLSDKLIDSLPSITQTKKLQAFFKDRFQDKTIDSDKINEEIEEVQIQGLTGYDLDTLINQVISQRPKQKSLFKRIIDNRNNIGVFRDQIFRASSKEQGDISGKIQFSCFQNENIVKLNIFGQGMQQVVHLKLEKDFISAVNAAYQVTNPLRDTIKTFYSQLRGKENVTMSNGVDIIKNKKFPNQHTILQNGRYRIIRGANFIMSKGHYLYFQLFENQNQVQLGSNKKNSKSKQNQHKKQDNLLTYQFQMNGQGADPFKYEVKLKGKNQKTIPFESFLKSYMTKNNEKIKFKYQNIEKSQKLITITKLSQQDKINDLLENIKEINRKKGNLVVKMISQFRQIFNCLLENIMKNQGS